MLGGALPEVAIVDYGVGNLFSVQNACSVSGLNARITSHGEQILSSQGVILPGVGSFAAAMDQLRKLDLIDAIEAAAASGKPFVGICLGMQLLMSESYEFGRHSGLGIIPGRVVRLAGGQESEHVKKVPQVSWNQLVKSRAPDDAWAGTPLCGLPDGVFMYFVHSYFVEPEDTGVIIARTEYGVQNFCSALQYRNIFACQCHPERSGSQGLFVYRNLARMLAQ